MLDKDIFKTDKVIESFNKKRNLNGIKNKIKEITGYDIFQDKKYRLMFFYIARKKYNVSYSDINDFVYPHSICTVYQPLLLEFMKKSTGIESNFINVLDYFNLEFKFVSKKKKIINQNKTEEKSKLLKDITPTYNLNLLKVKQLGYEDTATYILENGLDKFRVLKNTKITLIAK